ncbi:hypothetical protein HHO41_21230 [Bacillus sp. DNRA2]|uniref:hypothetical protein n=1 Tax=Bacillus sp. DNRA2 TaxID=2723053 RepID=UPI00145E0F26|nr:hypothetical protein [Bacillus sp. DNRA2]NMD72753.1 hypothetical protein [Bacillus sp. DNRA2]
MILKEIKIIFDYITENDVSDLFGFATPEEILDFYIYWDCVDDGMSDYVRRIMHLCITNQSFGNCKSSEEVLNWEMRALRELERRAKLASNKKTK